jgi:hypothetical protein
MSVVQISDVIVPEIFTGYSQQITAENDALINSGAVVADPKLDALLQGGGLTFHVPSWKDLDQDEENTGTDDPTQLSGAKKTSALQEIAVRLNRNQSWSTMDLTSVLAGADPASSIAQRVGNYWTKRRQAAFVALMKGVFADNAAAPTGSEHVLNDLSNDISGSVYSAGVTSFNIGGFVDAALTMGDAAEALGLLMVHSIVYGRMVKNDVIDFVPDSKSASTIPTFNGRRVVQSDFMPHLGGVFESWLFGAGAVRLGVASPQVPTEVKRTPEAGNGQGMETLFNRVQWCLHPVGYKYAGSAPSGGPGNSAATNNLANADSWVRVFTERKQIKIARLITREF